LKKGYTGTQVIQGRRSTEHKMRWTFIARLLKYYQQNKNCGQG